MLDEARAEVTKDGTKRKADLNTLAAVEPRSRLQWQDRTGGWQVVGLDILPS